MKTFALSALLALAIPAMAPAAEASLIQKSVASTERPDSDRERDARDKPGEVMAFAGIKPGMTVVDMFSAGGYWTELLAGAVGPSGKVLAVNNLPYAAFSKEGAAKRFTEGRLPNVERRLIEASWFNLPPKSADLVLIVMAFHDVYWIDEKEGWPEIHTDGFIESLKRVLKPGGKLVIIDHNAAAGSGKEAVGKLHRLNEEWVKKTLAAHGFVFEKAYDGLRNPADQFDKMVYDAAVKGKTDRYVQMYRVK